MGRSKRAVAYRAPVRQKAGRAVVGAEAALLVQGRSMLADDLDRELSRVAEVVAALREFDLERSSRVQSARAAGATWTQLARVLGISPQAVQQRYGSTREGVGD